VFGKVLGETSQLNTCALFTATVSYENRKNQAVDDEIVLRLLTESDVALAEIVDTSGTLKDIHNAMVPGIDAIYEWQLTFTNTD
jgi:hypothetical protein